MKVIAYTALLYGQEWLEYAMRSVIDAVDEYYVLYSPLGSHNGRKPVELPPGEDARHLYDIAYSVAGKRLRWYTFPGWGTEGEQRDSIFRLAPDAERIVNVDYDEIYSPGLVEAVIAASASRPDIRDWRVPMIHLWRDLHHAILHDPAYPIRLINPAAPLDVVETFDAHAHDEAKRELLARTTDHVPEFHSRIVHAGYAISPELMAAKWETHGHRNQYRQDIDWYSDRYTNPAAVTDLHPVGSEYWNAEPIDPLAYMPEYVLEHPVNAAVAA